MTLDDFFVLWFLSLLSLGLVGYGIVFWLLIQMLRDLNARKK